MLNSKFLALRESYNATPYPSYRDRKKILLKIKKSLVENEINIYQALKDDYGYRSEFDTFIAELLPSIMGVNYAIKNLKKWMKPSKRRAGIMIFPSSVAVHYQPLGVVGIVVPWNLPFFLALAPAVQALAAGNRVMIKMSEFTPHANQTLRKVLKDVVDHIVIIEGESGVGAEFSALPFDHLMFTGSTSVGRHIARAAADNLTPITLELGGKSPVIVDKHADINATVDSIILGKSCNAGQICVAPDYILIHSREKEKFIKKFICNYRKYFCNDNNNNRQTHIINDRHFKRLNDLIEDANSKGAQIHAVMDYDNVKGERVLYPHLLTNVSEDMNVMKEEVFGSIIPVLSYDTIDEAIEFINKRPHPLAIYLMSRNRKIIDKVLKTTHSGGMCVNDTAIHALADDSPFGGVGHSGMGHYRGQEGFETFSKAKTVLTTKPWVPKNAFLVQHRDFVLKILRIFFVRYSE